jgi:hypothetical protein
MKKGAAPAGSPLISAIRRRSEGISRTLRRSQPTTGKATAVAEMLSDHAQPTTGKSVGKPRHAMSNGDEVETLPRRNRWGSRASQMRMEAGKGRQGCDLAATAPNVCMRNGKPFGPPGGNVIAFVRC